MFLNLVCLYHCILPWEKCLANSGHFIKFIEWTRLIHKIAHCIKGISKFTNLKIIYFWSHMGFCVNKSHLCKRHQLSNCLHQNPRDHGYDTISILWQEKYKSYIVKKKANYSKWIASERMFPNILRKKSGQFNEVRTTCCKRLSQVLNSLSWRLWGQSEPKSE